MEETRYPAVGSDTMTTTVQTEVVHDDNTTNGSNAGNQITQTGHINGRTKLDQMSEVTMNGKATPRSSSASSTSSSTDQPDPDTIKMFVGQVPGSMDENQLRVMFEDFGPVFQINVLRDKVTGKSKGCCFVTFYTRKAALEAQNALHNIKTLPGMHHPIQMKPADTENRNERKLFVGMVSKKLNESDVRQLFNTFGTIEECTVLRDASGASKGCAFVTFSTRQCAILAIKAMHHSQTMDGCSSPMVVKFADTQKDKEQKKVHQLQSNLWNLASTTSRTPSILTPTFLATLPQLQNNPTHTLSTTPPLAAPSATGLNLNNMVALQQLLTGAPITIPTASILNLTTANHSSYTPILTVSSPPTTTTHTMVGQNMLMSNPSQQSGEHQLMNSALLSNYPGINVPAAYLQQSTRASVQSQNSLGVGPYAITPTMAQYLADPSLLQAMAQGLQNSSLMAAQSGSLAGGLTLGLGNQGHGVSAAETLAHNSVLQAMATSTVHHGSGQHSGSPFQSLSSDMSSQISGLRQHEGPDGANLFIYHLPQEFSDTDLYQTFAPFGSIISAKVFVDKQTHLSKCFGFVSYDNGVSAVNAIQAMNGFQIGSKRLKVQLKRSRDFGKPY